LLCLVTRFAFGLEPIGLVVAVGAASRFKAAVCTARDVVGIDAVLLVHVASFH